MFDFFKSLFRPEKPSSETAKERLRLVLLSDHIALSPEIIESLKADLLAVISRYVEIDSDQADVTFEHREREIAMLASVPIKGIREGRSGSAAPQPEPAARASAPASARANFEPELFPQAAMPAVESVPRTAEVTARSSVLATAESAAETVGAVSPPEADALSAEPAALGHAVPVRAGAEPPAAGPEDDTADWLALDDVAARPRRRLRAAQVSDVQRKPADAAFMHTQA